MNLTRKCNLRCRHCQYILLDKKHFDKNKEISISDIENILNKYDIDNCTVSAEGEPLMHSRFSEVIELLADRNISLNCVTNGILLDKYFDVVAKHIDMLIVSLGAYDAKGYEEIRNAGENVFGKVQDNIKKMIAFRDTKKENIVVAVKFDLHKNNLDHVEKMILKGNALKADLIMFGNINDEGTGDFIPLFREDAEVVKKIEFLKEKYSHLKIQWPVLIDMHNKGYCRMLFEGMVVNSDCSLSPCCHFLGNSDIYGNVFSMGKNGIKEFKENFLFAKNVEELDIHCQHCQRRMKF